MSREDRYRLESSPQPPPYRLESSPTPPPYQYFVDLNLNLNLNLNLDDCGEKRYDVNAIFATKLVQWYRFCRVNARYKIGRERRDRILKEYYNEGTILPDTEWMLDALID